MEYDITVVVPVHNAEKYIQRAMDSLLHQKGVNIQILLMENGSGDDSKIICDNYAAQYQNVEAYHLSEGNVSLARNEGIQYAKGRFISFVDADDYVAEGMYEKLLSDAEIEQSDIILFDYYRCIGDQIVHGDKIKDAQIYMKPEEDIRSALQKALISPIEQDVSNIMASVWRGIYRREFLLENKLLFDAELQIGEDLLFLIKALSFDANVKLLDQTYYYYVIENDSVTSVFSGDSWYKYEKMFLKLISEAADEGKLPDYEERIQIKLYKLSKWIISEAAKSHLKYSEKRKIIHNIYHSCDIIKKYFKNQSERSEKGIYDFLYRRHLVTAIIIVGGIVNLKAEVHKKSNE